MIEFVCFGGAQPCCGNTRLLQTILREEWHYKHIVVADCGAVTDFFTSHKTSSDAVHASSKAVLAGTDVECVWQGYAYEKLPEAVAKGLITEKERDRLHDEVMNSELYETLDKNKERVFPSSKEVCRH